MNKLAKDARVTGAASVAERLVIRVETRTRSRMLAYRHVANQLGRSTSWLRNLISEGRAHVQTDIMGKLDALLIRELEADIARLQAELAMEIQSGAHPASQRIGEIETCIHRARSLMDEK